MHESWHLVVVLISSSLMTNDVEHLSVCSFVLCVSFFLVKCLLGFCFHIRVSSVFYILWIHIFYQMLLANIFLQSMSYVSF